MKPTWTPDVPPPDPTRLDPPIEMAVVVSLRRERGAVPRVVAHLNRLHGHQAGSDSLESATSRILGSHELRVLVTHIDAEGRPTFELAPRDA